MKKVRIFRYRRDTGNYTFADYRCTAALEEGQEPENGGDHRKNGGSIRILSKEPDVAEPGDWAGFDMERETPDKGKDLLITMVRDNRRGGLPHWRLIVNGRARASVNT